MNPQVIRVALMLLKDKRIRNFVIILSVLIFFFLIVSFYVITNPWVILYPGNVQQVVPNMTETQFIEAVATDARVTYQSHKIYPSVTIAQAILESDWGQSGLTQRANNLFGIKAFNWLGPIVSMMTREEYNGISIMVMANFRAYPTWKESIVDHAQFLRENSRYEKAGVFSAKNFQEQAAALQMAGYATDSQYSKKLVELILKYDLGKYDVMEGF